MFTIETLKLNTAKAAIEGKIKGYRKGLDDMGDDYPQLRNKYEDIIEELEDILKIIED